MRSFPIEHPEFCSGINFQQENQQRDPGKERKCHDREKSTGVETEVENQTLRKEAELTLWIETQTGNLIPVPDVSCTIEKESEKSFSLSRPQLYPWNPVPS